jgi:hypothetical protein
MSHEPEQDGTETKPEEERKQPYEQPRVTKHLITRAEKEKLIAEREETKDEQSKGNPAGVDSLVK